MLSKKHYTGSCKNRRKIKCLKKKKKRGCPITTAAATEWSRERGSQGLSAHVVSIIHITVMSTIKKELHPPSPHPAEQEFLIDGLTEN